VKTFILFALVVALSCLVPGQLELRAQPKSKDADKLAAAIKAAEAKAFAEVVKALEAHAKWCTSMQAYEEARQQWRLIAVVKHDPKAAEKGYAALAGKADDPKEKFASEAEAQRQKLMTAAGKALLDFVADARKKDGDDLALEAALIWQMFFRDDAVADERGLVWSETLGSLVLKEDVAPMEAGELRHQGVWLDKAAVEKVNNSHASMLSPWELTDGFNTLTTNLELLRAKLMLSYCARFRMLCYSRFGMEMGLRYPAGKLPVYITRERKEYVALWKKLSPSGGFQPDEEFGNFQNIQKRTLCPMATCLEKPWNKVIYKLAPQYFCQCMNHELTHQLLFEGLKWKEEGGLREGNLWVIQGIGSYMESWFWLDSGWQFKPTKTYTQTEDGTQITSRTIQAKAAKDTLKPLPKFVVEAPREFMESGALSYSHAAALVQFLMDETGPAQRLKFIRLLTEVHASRDDRDSFRKFFKDDDLEKMNTDFLAFLDGLEPE
jgi:hypothetical protein